MYPDTIAVLKKQVRVEVIDLNLLRVHYRYHAPRAQQVLGHRSPVLLDPAGGYEYRYRYSFTGVLHLVQLYTRTVRS